MVVNVVTDVLVQHFLPLTNRSGVSPVHHDFKTLDFSPAYQVSVITSLAPSSQVRKVLRDGPRIPN